jgi:D-amino-acid dehydrogenase
MATHQSHVIVVGGGVIGVCCAYFLAKRGANVTVLERDGIGQGASYGNAGVVAPGHPPIAKPGRIKQAFKGILDPASPLYIAPRWDPSLVKWLWAFRAACTQEHLAATMRLLGPLGHATRELFDQLIEEEDIACDYRTAGFFEVFRTPDAFTHARDEAAWLQSFGYHPEVLTGDAMREREPALKEGTLGAVHFPEAATCNPHRFVLEMAERTRRHGGSVRTGSSVAEVLTSNGRATGVRTTGGEMIDADTVILATGAYSLELAAKLGYPLPIQPGKGYHRDREIGAGGTPSLEHTCMLAERSVFCTPLSGFVRYAGTLEFSGWNHTIRPQRLEQLTRAAGVYLDGIGDGASTSEWCGLRPCTPDGLPVVGPVPGSEGVFIAAGHAMLGLTLGPITGKLVSELVLDTKPSTDIGMLRVDRFA